MVSSRMHDATESLFFEFCILDRLTGFALLILPSYAVRQMKEERLWRKLNDVRTLHSRLYSIWRSSYLNVILGRKLYSGPNCQYLYRGRSD